MNLVDPKTRKQHYTSCTWIINTMPGCCSARVINYVETELVTPSAYFKGEVGIDVPERKSAFTSIASFFEKYPRCPVPKYYAFMHIMEALFANPIRLFFVTDNVRKDEVRKTNEFMKFLRDNSKKFGLNYKETTRIRSSHGDESPKVFGACFTIASHSNTSPLKKAIIRARKELNEYSEWMRANYESAEIKSFDPYGDYW